MLQLQPTKLVLFMEPEFVSTGTAHGFVKASYGVLDTSDKCEVYAYQRACAYDASSANLMPDMQRQIVGAVVRHPITHQLFVQTASGITPLTDWVKGHKH